MPRFSIGQLVHYTGALDGSYSERHFYKQYSPKYAPFTVLGYEEFDRVRITLNNDKGWGIVNEGNLVACGPPTTVREMSYAILKKLETA